MSGSIHHRTRLMKHHHHHHRERVLFAGESCAARRLWTSSPPRMRIFQSFELGPIGCCTLYIYRASHLLGRPRPTAKRRTGRAASCVHVMYVDGYLAMAWLFSVRPPALHTPRPTTESLIQLVVLHINSGKKKKRLESSRVWSYIR